MAPLHDWVYGWAFVMTLVAVGAVYCARGLMRSHRGQFAPHEQMRERTPWPPPPISATVHAGQASYEKAKEMLALPRGDR